MSKTNTGRNAAVLAAIAVLAVAGGLQYFQKNMQDPQSPVTAASPAAETGNANAPAAILPSVPSQQAGDPGAEIDRKELFILTVATNDNGSFLEKKPLSPTSGGTETLSNGQEAERALNAMADEGENSPLPKGTRALSVTFDDELATVDFNEAFQKNFAGGDEDEALALNAVLATVGQFPGVKHVQILVDGQKIDSLGGNQSLGTPLPIPNNLALAKSEQ
ncbi:MAG: GerMN domain-containing protein [Armatimonadota bacterium]